MQEIAGFQKRIDTFQEELAAAEKHYGTTLLSAEDTTLFTKLKDLDEAYDKHIDKIDEMVSSGASADAMNAYTDSKEYTENIDDLNSILDQITLLNVDAAQQTSDSNTKTANAAIATMLLILGIAVITAIILGIFLTLSITKPINAVVATAKKTRRRGFCQPHRSFDCTVKRRSFQIHRS